ncbi:MAG: hypothetical protein VB108_02945 [Anaerolineaceae bacterium]|nr:hypothetical protein [Anaerolineaceae bacterium]
MDASSLGFASGSFTQATAFYAWKQVSAGCLLVSDQLEGDKIHQVWQK